KVAATAANIAPPPTSAAPALTPPGQRIALASDAAFTFVYPHVLEGWRRAGAEIVTFSPLNDEAPPESSPSSWLPAAYPHFLRAPPGTPTLFRQGLLFLAEPRSFDGECGGYLVPGEGLEDADRARHAMTGLLGHATSFAERKLHLGYRVARLLCDGPLGPA